VEDNFPRNNRIRFSWDSRRRDGSRILARLDRFYSFNYLGVNATEVDYRILGDSVHSDHLPVWRQVWLDKEDKR
jgi:endonuclease/exonuclease/phosphatase family metal-dependent hydrolase